MPTRCIKRSQAEQALLNNAIAVYEQDVEGEPRFVSYGETSAGRMLAVIRVPRKQIEMKTQSREAHAKGIKMKGSALLAKLENTKKSSVQIALRLPEVDLNLASTIAERKGIGYQLLKMLVHEGLKREARRR